MKISTDDVYWGMLLTDNLQYLRRLIICGSGVGQCTNNKVYL
ncbi:MAG TPA: hypothetical protein VEP90_19400 [Methylomirabilota bacterium]|nr:hypothetical protein [Methylomirabilota bacterium]